MSSDCEEQFLICWFIIFDRFHSPIIEEYSAKRGLSPRIIKIELASISATESLFLHSVKVNQDGSVDGSLVSSSVEFIRILVV